MKKYLSLLVAVIIPVFLGVSCGAGKKVAEKSSKGGIAILFENDVHCAVDGYAGFAALKAELEGGCGSVLTVSCGDFVQGGSLGSVSKGRNIVDVMNETGYDFVTLGNHEFDYGIPRQQELMDALGAVCLCCNFKDLRTGRQIYDAYRVVECGGVKLGLIGMSTPYTINSSTPTYFKDADGNYIYSFCIDDFYETVQRAIDGARKDGAEYIVVLSHLGDEYQGEGGINSPSMIAGTTGIDVVLDGHSHSVIPGTYLKDKSGKDVLLTSTGTKFANYGVLKLEGGKFYSELIPAAGYTPRDSWVAKVVEGIKEGYRKVAEQVVFTSEVRLRSYDDARNRLVRSVETNLGDFCTDAYREVFGTDVAILGGGSIREDLPEGDVNFNDVYTMFPFENGTCKATISGELLLDVLEFSVSIYPDEFGGFQQVSGLKFEFDPSIPSPVRYDEHHNFAGVEGERRVRSVMVLDRESGAYEPLDPARDYSIAASTYLILDKGDGYAMMSGCRNVEDAGLLDTEIIQRYVSEHLSGNVDKRYSETQRRIIVR